MEKRLFTLTCLFLIIFNISAQKKIPPEKPKLIIGIVIEQMRYDYLTRYWDKYEEGGFKRLINEGTLCKNTFYDYLLTHSSSGYATIATGANPSQHGIIADEWYVRLKKLTHYCTKDDEKNTVGGSTTEGKMSPVNLFTSTFSDELRLASNFQSKIISIALKDYAAILPAGHVAIAAYWMENATGNWITSSYYMESIPNWVTDFNNKKFPDLYLNREWTSLLPVNEYKESIWDKNTYEIGIRSQNTFPYNLVELKQKSGNYNLLKYTPFGNTYTKDFAISAILNENLGKNKTTDYLAISFSANGYISDAFGPRAVEIEDLYLRLDKDIAHLLNFIDEFLGKENVLVYLSSDRGTGDIPQYLLDVKMPAGYFYPKGTMAVLKSYLKAIYGSGDWIKGYFDQQIYLNQPLIEDSKLSLADFQLKTAQFLVQFQGISNAITATTLQTTSFTEGILKKFQNSYHQNRSADVILNLLPGWVEKNEDAKTATVATHCSGYNYDTHVPLIWYGWKMKRTTVARQISVCDIAPTISSFLGIPNPNACTGKPISELFE